MTNQHAGNTIPTDRFDDVAALLRSYPDISDRQLQELKEWFKQASSFDEASLAANESLASGYSQFRADHIDNFTWKELIFGILGLLVILGIIAVIGYLAP